MFFQIMQTIKKICYRILDEIGFILQLLCGTCLVYIVVISQLCVFAGPLDFLTVVVEYDPRFDLGPVQQGDGMFKFIPVIAKGFAAFYYNMTFFIYSLVMFININIFFSFFWHFSGSLSLLSNYFEAVPPHYFYPIWASSFTYDDSIIKYITLNTIILVGWLTRPTSSFVFYYSENVVNFLVHVGFSLTVFLRTYTRMEELFMTMSDSRTFTDIAYCLKDVLIWTFSNSWIVMCVVYPIGLITLSIMFLIKNNLSFIKLFFAEKGNVMVFFNKWYEKSLFLKILVIYNTFFLLIGVFHIFMSKLHWFKSIDFSDNYLAKSLACDSFSLMSIFFIILFILIFFTISFNTFKNLSKTEVIFSITMSMGVISILVQLTDIFLVYIGIIIISLSIYPLIALDKASAGNTEAAAKYFFMGAVSSGVMLYGISLIYREFSSVKYIDINQVCKLFVNDTGMSYTVFIGFIFIIFGFFFKLSLIPLQNWTPDVYLGSPTVITCFLATIVKFGVYCSFIRFYYSCAVNYFLYDDLFKNFIIIFSLGSIIVGAWGAIDQFKIKRFIGFTTINQMGFIMLGLSLNNFYGFISSYIYICIYTMLNLLLFSFLINISVSTIKGVREIVYLTDLIPFFKYNRFSAFTFIFLIFSLAGMPPTIGFYMKLLVLKALVFSGYYKLTIFILYINIISIFYYFRIIKLMFFDADKMYYKRSLNKDNIVLIDENESSFFNGITFNIFTNTNYTNTKVHSIVDVLMSGELFSKLVIGGSFKYLYHVFIWFFISGVWLNFLNINTISFFFIKSWNDLNFQSFDSDITISSIELVSNFIKLF